MAAPTPAELAGVAPATRPRGAPTPAELAGVATTQAKAAAKKKGGGGGVAGTIKRIPGDFVRGGISAAQGLPGGLADAARLVAGDLAAANILSPGKITSRGAGQPDFSFKGTRQLGKETVKGTAETIRHPLRDPFQTTLLGFGGASVVAGGAARLAAASSAARTAGAGAAARAAVKRPTPGPRELRFGDMTVRGHYSPAALSRGVQKTADAALKAGAKRSERVENVLHRRAAKWEERTARTEDARTRAPGTRVAALGAKLKPEELRALRVVAEEVPLLRRIAAQEMRLARATNAKERARHQERIDLNRKAAAFVEIGDDGKPRFRDDQKKLKVVYAAMQRASKDREGMVKQLGLMDDAGFQAAKDKAARFAAGARYEKPTPAKQGRSPAVDAAQRRVNRLQKIYDRFEAQGRRGGYKVKARPRTVDEARARLAVLEKRHEGFFEKVYATMFRDKLTPEDVAEQARRNRENAKFDRQQSGLTRSGRASGASGAKVPRRQKTVKQEQRDIVDAEIDRTLERMGDHPSAVRARAERAEIYALRKALEPDPDTVFAPGAGKNLVGDSPAAVLRRYRDLERKVAAGERRVEREHGVADFNRLGTPTLSNWKDWSRRRGYTEKEIAEFEEWLALNKQLGITEPDGTPGIDAPFGMTDAGVLEAASAASRRFGTVEDAVFVRSKPSLERVGGALSYAKEDLVRARNQAAGRVRQTGVIGAEDVTVSPDAPYIGNPVERSRATGQPKVSSTRTFGHTQKPGSFKTATGSAVERARERNDVTNIIAERHAEAARLTAIDRRVRRVKGAGSTSPLRKDDVWVWTDKTVANERIPKEVRRYLDDPEGIAKLPEDQQDSLIKRIQQSRMERHDWRDPETVAEFERLAEQGKGVFVPRRLLGNAAKRDPNINAVPGVGAIDAVNNAQKAALIYLKANYVLIQTFSNVAMNIIQQGFLYPRNITHAVMLERRLGPEYAAMVDDLMGTGSVMVAAFHGQGRISVATQKLARIMSSKVDTPARRAAFYHEARKAGFDTPEKMRALLDEPKHAPKLAEVNQRSIEAIVDYSEMSPAERSIARRLAFVYPWQKGATKYAGHYLRDHPVQAAVLASVGAQGTRVQDETVGDRPSYLRGVFDVGGRLVNPAGVNFFETPATIAAASHGYLTGDRAAPTGMEFLAPAPLALVAALTRRDEIGRELPSSPPAAAHRLFVEGVPAYEALRSALGKGSTSRTFPDPDDALYRFFLGGLYPRRYNRPALNQNAARERAGR